MEIDAVREMLNFDESPILEFKRQWYWDKTSSADNIGIQWGEFYKDIIALCNAYIGYAGKDRYLIIGFCENTLKIHNVDFSLSPLNDLKSLRKNIIERLERLVEIPPLSLQLHRVDLGKR